MKQFENINETGYIDYNLYSEYNPQPLKECVENKKYLIAYYDLFKLLGEYPCIFENDKKITLTHSHILLLTYMSNIILKSNYDRCFAFVDGTKKVSKLLGVTSKEINNWLDDLEKSGFIKKQQVDSDATYRHINFGRIKYIINKKCNNLKPCEIPEEMFNSILSAFGYYKLINKNDNEKKLACLEFLRDSYKIKNEINETLNIYEWFELLGTELGIPKEKISETINKIKANNNS